MGKVIFVKKKPELKNPVGLSDIETRILSYIKRGLSEKRFKIYKLNGVNGFIGLHLKNYVAPALDCSPSKIKKNLFRLKKKGILKVRMMWSRSNWEYSVKFINRAVSIPEKIF